ncbi:MAG: hypothetical protein KA163_05320 [Bacteroidia bacterium]|nr:hypothetical protein [Bacteroidia bacterium]
MNKIPFTKFLKQFSILVSVLLVSCSQPSADDLLLSSAPGPYSISYNRELGLFLIKNKEAVDTVSLWDNWLYSLYRYRQQEKNIPSTTSYDEFIKSEWFCLPGAEQQFKLLNADPMKVFTSSPGPSMCDCITEDGNYRSGDPACEEKFQSYRINSDNNLSWQFSYFRDVCNGKVSDTVGFDTYKDSLLMKAKRAEIRMRWLKHIQDSLDAGKPKRRCSAYDYIPPHARSHTSRDSEQCRAMTTTGRCGRHGG